MTSVPAPSLLRTILAGLAGGVLWLGGFAVTFGPAQAILADPDFQSVKFLTVMGDLEPLPRVAGAPWILPLGILSIGILYAFAYRIVRPAFTGKPLWKRGTTFGGVAWLLMVPWFEFYLPWNAMHEPVALVLLEMACWLGVMLLVGVSIAWVMDWRRRDPAV